MFIVLHKAVDQSYTEYLASAGDKKLLQATIEVLTSAWSTPTMERGEGEGKKHSHVIL